MRRILTLLLVISALAAAANASWPPGDAPYRFTRIHEIKVARSRAIDFLVAGERDSLRELAARSDSLFLARGWTGDRERFYLRGILEGFPFLNSLEPYEEYFNLYPDFAARLYHGMRRAKVRPESYQGRVNHQDSAENLELYLHDVFMKDISAWDTTDNDRMAASRFIRILLEYDPPGMYYAGNHNYLRMVDGYLKDFPRSKFRKILQTNYGLVVEWDRTGLLASIGYAFTWHDGKTQQFFDYGFGPSFGIDLFMRYISLHLAFESRFPESRRDIRFDTLTIANGTEFALIRSGLSIGIPLRLGSKVFLTPVFGFTSLVMNLPKPEEALLGRDVEFTASYGASAGYKLDFTPTYPAWTGFNWGLRHHLEYAAIDFDRTYDGLGISTLSTGAQFVFYLGGAQAREPD